MMQRIVRMREELEKAYDKADAYEKVGDYKTAIKWSETALKLAERQFGKNSDTYSIFLANLARLYRLTERHGDAEKLLTQALHIVKAQNGENSEKYAVLVNNLAELQTLRGRYESAESF